MCIIILRSRYNSILYHSFEKVVFLANLLVHRQHLTSKCNKFALEQKIWIICSAN